MSVKAMAWAWEQPLPSHTTKIVLIALADHADAAGTCWPGIAGIAEKCDMDPRTVQFHIRKLAVLGLVRCSARTIPGTKKRTTNSYSLNLGNDPALRGEQDSPPGVNAIQGGGEQDSPPNRGIEPSSEPSSLEPSTEKSARENFLKEAEEVLAYLNAKTRRTYRAREADGRPTANLDRFILPRLKAGATVAECRAVIDLKCRQWLGVPEKAEYLRPATLFNREKFEQYLGELADVGQARRADAARSRPRTADGLQPVSIPSRAERDAMLEQAGLKKVQTSAAPSGGAP